MTRAFYHKLTYTEKKMKKIYVITEKCCECGSCAHFCKNHAIEYDYAGQKYEIDKEQCDGCGTCMEYCPIDDAIVEAYGDRDPVALYSLHY